MRFYREVSNRVEDLSANRLHILILVGSLLEIVWGEKMLNKLFYFAMVVLLVFLVSCSRSAQDEQTLVVGLEDAPKTLDPRYATDAYGMRITQHLLFSTLVRYGYDLKIEPDLAQKWEMPDDKTYIFHLRKGVTFHDGTPLTARDVKFTIEHLLNKKTASPFASTYKGKIARIRVMDDHTIQFVLTKPMASFLTALIVPVLPRHLLEKGEFPAKMIGSGPFTLVAEKPNSIELAAYENYFGGAPAVKRILFKIIQDNNTRFLKMKKGKLDLLINAIADKRIDDFKQEPLNATYNVIEKPGISYNYIAFNFENQAVDNLTLRRAVAYAINVDEIIKHKVYGHAVKATGLLSPVNWYYEGDVVTYAHDPAKSIEILDTGGYADPDGDGPQPRLTLEMKVSNNASAVEVARILQAQLGKVGIRLDIRPYEWGTFYGDIKSGNFQMTSMRWVGVTEPDFYYDIFHSSQKPPMGRNRGRYSNEKLDSLLEQGRTELDPQQRKTIYADVQKIVALDVPYISLWHPNNVSIVHRRVKNYRQHPQGGFVSFRNLTLDDV